MMRTNVALALASAVVAGFAVSLGPSGCSSSSSGAVDAAFDPSTYDGPLGVGLANCVPDNCASTTTFCTDAAVNCPSPGICGGTLAGPNQPISYCALSCTKSSDCPTGAACETHATQGTCLKVCTSNSDCSGGFACTLDGGAAGSLCWSPYTGADGVPEGGSPDTGNGDANPGSEAAAPDASGAETGTPEAGNDAAADGGDQSDAPASDASDAGSDGPSE
jgi:hypothetical protein